MPAKKPDVLGRATEFVTGRRARLGPHNCSPIGQQAGGQALAWNDNHLRTVEPGVVVGGNSRAALTAVIVPGFSGDFRTCEVLAETLATLDYRVIGLNLPGHFGAPMQELSLHHLTKDFVAKVERYTNPDELLLICAASAGTSPAWGMADAFRNRTQCLVQVCATDYANEKSYGQMLRGLPKELVADKQKFRNSPVSPSDTRRAVAHILNDMRGAWSFGRFTWNMDATSSIQQFAQNQETAKVPVVLLGAEHDESSPPWMFLRTVLTVDPDVAVMVPDAGHLFCTMEGEMAQAITKVVFQHAMRDARELQGLPSLPFTNGELRNPVWKSLQGPLDDIAGRSTPEWIVDNLFAQNPNVEYEYGSLASLGK